MTPAATMTTSDVSVALFTRDLRVHDNPTLHGALEHAGAVVPLFVVDPSIVRGSFARRTASRSWPMPSRTCRRQLRERHGELLVFEGDTVEVVGRVVSETGVSPCLRGSRRQRSCPSPVRAPAGRGGPSGRL